MRPIKTTLINAIEELPANAWTPLVETYDETLRYLSGEPVKYGKKYGSIACKSEDKLVKETLSQPTGNCLRYDVIEVCNGQRDYYGRCYVTGLSSTACSTRDDYISYFRPWWGGANRCYIRPAQVENKDVCLEPELETIETEFIKTVNNCSAISNDNYFYLSHHDTYDNSGNYITPINDTCQSNHVIIFTDGESSYDADSDVRIRNFVKDIDSDKSYITKNCSTDPNGTNNILDDSCMEELALYAQTQDIIDDSRINLDDNSSDEGKQNVTTYTIGGFVSQGDVIDTRLNNTATAGGGTYIRVEKGTGYDELREALVNTFAKIQTKSANFTAPSVAVNALNRLENSSELYFTLFSPSNSIGWEGNLKRYRLGSDGKIYGINDTEPAVNSTTGFFDETATSFWTEAEDAPDGKTVSKGGAARRLTASRNVITHLSNSSGAINDKFISSGSGSNPTINSNFTKSLFNADSISDVDFNNLVLWGAGLEFDSNGGITSRRAIEDPLHSKPAVIHYGANASTGILDSTIFFGTNSGYLHAIDSNINDPKERFAFIPRELLPNILEYRNNTSTLGKVYGLDGPISTLLVESGDNDTRLVIDSNDKAYIYVGMRRGGRSYYALDVSDRDAPELMWQIDGGIQGFEELGQTWSEMTPINVNPAAIGVSSNEDSIKVLVFGGGYDGDEDNNDTVSSTRITHDQGKRHLYC